MTHLWRRASGEIRTVFWHYDAPKEIMDYLADMRDATQYAVVAGFYSMRNDFKKRIPSPITLRSLIQDWFFSRYDYSRRHLDFACKKAVTVLKTNQPNKRGKLSVPVVRNLSITIDYRRFKLVGEMIRITLQPGRYVWIPLNKRNKHFEEYSKGKAVTLDLTKDTVYLTFNLGPGRKEIGRVLAGCDMNFGSVEISKARMTDGENGKSIALLGASSIPTGRITEIQDDFLSHRRRLQLHVRNPAKRQRLLRRMRARCQNRVKDTLHKLTTRMVEENPEASFVFENLRGMRTNRKVRSIKKLRASVNRWPQRMYQQMAMYKSPNKAFFVSPKGTSSNCPICNGKMEHPSWMMGRCANCGVDYERNRLTSLAILLRGLHKCGYPFTMSADASWQSVKDEYLYPTGQPESCGEGGTEAANAPNGTISTESSRNGGRDLNETPVRGAVDGAKAHQSLEGPRAGFEPASRGICEVSQHHSLLC